MQLVIEVVNQPPIGCLERRLRNATKSPPRWWEIQIRTSTATT